MHGGPHVRERNVVRVRPLGRPRARHPRVLTPRPQGWLLKTEFGVKPVKGLASLRRRFQQLTTSRTKFKRRWFVLVEVLPLDPTAAGDTQNPLRGLISSGSSKSGMSSGSGEPKAASSTTLRAHSDATVQSHKTSLSSRSRASSASTVEEEEEEGGADIDRTREPGVWLRYYRNEAVGGAETALGYLDVRSLLAARISHASRAPGPVFELVRCGCPRPPSARPRLTGRRRLRRLGASTRICWRHQRTSRRGAGSAS